MGPLSTLFSRISLQPFWRPGTVKEGGEKTMEVRGIDPRTSCVLSERPTICAITPCCPAGAINCGIRTQQGASSLAVPARMVNFGRIWSKSTEVNFGRIWSKSTEVDCLNQNRAKLKKKATLHDFNFKIILIIIIITNESSINTNDFKHQMLELFKIHCSLASLSHHG
jgi:hypothetical protein